ncbi:MAG: hypothetical protein C6I00_04525 [Nitratiruptor sp.]|nr:hypothetical protein [Nitratiruptor sp.]NPA84355.1 hypothetical protein [Campylobacterota bacterium]
MAEFPFLLLFWYGVLHAFGPDHLMAIADFSIGKDRLKTMAITLAFALGHGVSLFLFAKLLNSFPLTPRLLVWGDIISAIAIGAIGLFLLFMALTNRINVGWHEHGGKRHIHIWFGREHDHEKGELGGPLASALTLGTLMGIGGVRGMLVTLSAITHNAVNFWMVISFTLGVMVVFLLFGLLLGLINEHLLQTRERLRIAFGIVGATSLIVGGSMLM